jgi:hypothetical protein
MTRRWVECHYKELVNEEPEEIIAFRDSESDEDAAGMTLLRSTGRLKNSLTNIHIMVFMVMTPQSGG